MMPYRYVGKSALKKIDEWGAAFTFCSTYSDDQLMFAMC